jgi:hypothetical protein
MHIQRQTEANRSSILSIRRLDSFLQNSGCIDAALGISLEEGPLRSRV